MKLRIALINRLILAFALGLPAAQATTTSSMAKVNLASLAPHGHYSRFIVSYRNGSAEESSPMLAMAHLHAAVARSSLGSLGANNASPLKLIYRRRLAIGADLVSTSHSLSTNAATTLMRHIAADPDVTYVEPDTLAELSSYAPKAGAQPFLRQPSEPMLFYLQWNLTNPRSGINVEKAWTKTDGRGIVVAVIDDGITRHFDLDTRLADDGYDFITDHKISGRATDGRIAGGWDPGSWSPGYDSSWHGTGVAGIIAEQGILLAGIAPKARVLPLRVCGHRSQDSGSCWASDIHDAIIWAAGGHVPGVPDNTHPAQVINISLRAHSHCTLHSTYGEATAWAISHGATVVVAAGNDNADANNSTPASCVGVISVAATNIRGQRAPYSNYGNSVTIAAPGGSRSPGPGSTQGPTKVPYLFLGKRNLQSLPCTPSCILSASNSGKTKPEQAFYAAQKGTSLSAPHVSGVVALILSAEKAAGKPLSTPEQIKTILTETARPFPVTPDKPIGAGILDAGAAVDRVLKQ